MAVINGTAGNDTLVGGDTSDFMYGLDIKFLDEARGHRGH